MDHKTKKETTPVPESGRRRKRSDIDRVIIFFVIIVAAIFVMSVTFRVSDISVEGNSHYTDNEIIRAIDIENGDNLFFYDRFATISRVFAKLPYVEEISVERSLPNKVRITVTECKALAYLVIGDEYWTMDHNCKILGKANNDELADLIAVTGLNPGTLMIGETLTVFDGSTKPVELLSEVLQQIQDRGYAQSVRKIEFSPDGRISFRFGNVYNVILGGADSIDKKFSLFVSAMGKLAAGDYGTIDVSDASSVFFTPN